MDAPEGFMDCLDFWDGRARASRTATPSTVSPYILLTDDGGRSWRRDSRRCAMPPANDGEGGFAASGTCARAGDSGRGWIVTGAGGSARAFTTVDYGETWTAAEVPMARGDAAGNFHAGHVADGSPLMALGGDLGAARRGRGRKRRRDPGTEAAPGRR